MNKSNNIIPQQWISLNEEIHTSIKLIQLGIKELQEISHENDFYHLPLLLLSSGFERFMKCMICLKYLDEYGKFPTSEEIKSLGHDLVNLKEKIISDCTSKETASERPATNQDNEFLTGDKDLDKFIRILSDFGKNARYHNLNVVGGKSNALSDVKARVEEFELQLIMRKYEKDSNNLKELLRDVEKADVYYKEIYDIIIKKLLRFARALARKFTSGDLGKEARIYDRLMKPFLNLKDEEL